jgi:hypothetical protein
VSRSRPDSRPESSLPLLARQKVPEVVRLRRRKRTRTTRWPVRRPRLAPVGAGEVKVAEGVIGEPVPAGLAPRVEPVRRCFGGGGFKSPATTAGTAGAPPGKAKGARGRAAASTKKDANNSVVGGGGGGGCCPGSAGYCDPSRARRVAYEICPESGERGGRPQPAPPVPLLARQKVPEVVRLRRRKRTRTTRWPAPVPPGIVIPRGLGESRMRSVRRAASVAAGEAPGMAEPGQQPPPPPPPTCPWRNRRR